MEKGGNSNHSYCTNSYIMIALHMSQQIVYRKRRVDFSLTYIGIFFILFYLFYIYIYLHLDIEFYIYTHSGWHVIQIKFILCTLLALTVVVCLGPSRKSNSLIYIKMRWWWKTISAFIFFSSKSTAVKSLRNVPCYQLNVDFWEISSYLKSNLFWVDSLYVTKLSGHFISAFFNLHHFISPWHHSYTFLL